MDKKMKVYLSMAVLGALVFGLYLFSGWISSITGFAIEKDTGPELAKCISDRGLIFYIEDECDECDKQLGVFGSLGSETVKTFDCTSQECPAGWVPAWKIGDRIYHESFNLRELAELSGC